MKKLTELTQEELEALTLEEFQERIVGEVKERFVASFQNLNDLCLPYVEEDEGIVFIYSTGAIAILKVGGPYDLTLGQPKDILTFSSKVLCQVFSIGIGIEYKKAKDRWRLNRDARRDAKIEEEERKQYQILHAKYGDFI